MCCARLNLFWNGVNIGRLIVYEPLMLNRRVIIAFICLLAYFTQSTAVFAMNCAMGESHPTALDTRSVDSLSNSSALQSLQVGSSNPSTDTHHCHDSDQSMDLKSVNTKTEANTASGSMSCCDSGSCDLEHCSYHVVVPVESFNFSVIISAKSHFAAYLQSVTRTVSVFFRPPKF